MADVYRFPADLNAIIDEILDVYGKDPRLKDLLLDRIGPMLFDRDITLEDYLTEAGAGGSFPFLTVAADGSGDYTSIKTAIDAVGTITSGNQAATYIYVKPSVADYDDTGGGRVELGDKRVVVYCAAAAERSNNYQTWASDGIKCTTNPGYFTIHGLELSVGSTIDFASTGGGDLFLTLQRCQSDWRGLVGSSIFVNANIFESNLGNRLFSAGTGAASAARIRAFNSTLVAAAAGSTAPTLTNVNQFLAVGCQIASAASLVLTQSGDAGELVLIGCELQGTATWTTSLSRVMVTGCGTSWNLTGLSFTCSGPSASHWAEVTFAGNALVDSVITTGINTRASIQGHYRRIDIGSSESSAFVALDLRTGTAQTAVNITGDGNMVVASLRPGSSSTNQAVNIASGADDNTVIYAASTTVGFATGDTNSGLRNRINSFAPSGAAGGDLSGTFPNPLIDLLTRATGTTLAARTRVTGDTGNRWQIDAAGRMDWGSGAGAVDTSLRRSAADTLATDDDFSIITAGKGLKVAEGSNAKMGTATLVLGVATVATTAVTANSRIFITVQSLGTVATPKAVSVTARTAATSFTITSADLTDTSVVAWMLVEPA